MKAIFFFQGTEGQLLLQEVGEQTHIGTLNVAFDVVDGDPPEATTWRIAFEDESTNADSMKFLDFLSAVLNHAFGEIPMGSDFDKADVAPMAFKLDGCARDPETDFHFGAHRYPTKNLTQPVGDPSIPFMCAVITDAFAPEAGADPESDFGYGYHGHDL